MQALGHLLWSCPARVMKVVKRSTDNQEKSSATTSGVYISMKSIPVAVGVLVTVLACVCSLAASPCATQGATSKPDAKHRSEQVRTESARKPPADTSKPCDETNNQLTESREAQTGEWDPVSCWDCTRPGEPVGFFLVGLLLAAPIFLWVIRARARRGSQRPRSDFCNDQLLSRPIV